MIPNVSQDMHQIYGPAATAPDHVRVPLAIEADALVVTGAEHGDHSNSLLYGLTLLKEKVHQIQSLVGILVSPYHHHDGRPGYLSTPVAVASMGNLIQEVIMTTSSMMFTCQQMMSATTTPHGSKPVQTQPKSMFDPNEGGARLDWYVDSNNFVISCGSNQHSITNNNHHHGTVSKNNSSNNGGGSISSMKNNSNNIGCGNTTDCDVIEPDATELLAKYSHYCQVCGKGFKRDTNLRMHMRAHGDKFKSNSALSNPMKSCKDHHGCNKDRILTKPPARKYSCPQEGCRWNQKHTKFQALKSMICVKNHYKRSHCPKMYFCKRCNRKQFSVLSDLRTHEKHCGNLEWQCSCGTTFSRKDKLMGHVGLFIGHNPAVNITKPATGDNSSGPAAAATSIKIDDS